MQILDPNAVESLELAGGASHRVRTGTLKVAGAMVLGEPTPVVTFTDVDTGESLTVPRHAVVGFGGEGALTAPAPPPPPPAPDPLAFDLGGGYFMNFRSAAELEPLQRAEMIANLESAIAECNNALRLEAGYQAAAALWIRPDDPYVRAHQQRNNTPANGGITSFNFPEYDQLITRCKNVMRTSVMVDHVRNLLAIGEAEFQGKRAEAVSA